MEYRTQMTLAAVLLGLLVGAMAFMAIFAFFDWRDFFAECEQHRPRYECTALWRGSPSAAVPILIPR